MRLKWGLTHTPLYPWQGKWIEDAILAVIQRVSWYVRHNEKEFTERVREASDQNQEKTVKECKQKISKAQKRHKELDWLVKKLYEGNTTGKITPIFPIFL